MRIIAGTKKGKKLFSPSKDLPVRPTSDRARESLFDLLLHAKALQDYTIQDKVFADICAGSGSVGLEALSRGAKRTIFVENHHEIAKTLQKNIEHCGFLPLSLTLMQDYQGLSAPSKVDVLFMDAPYHGFDMHQAMRILHHQGWFHQTSLTIMQTHPDYAHPNHDCNDESSPFHLLLQKNYNDGIFWFFAIDDLRH